MSVSAVLGWMYFISWSASFYPQVLLNCSRKSAEGLSPQYVQLNLLGFSLYTVYTSALYFSPTVRLQYRERWGSDNQIQLNDVVFAIHALIMCAVMSIQAALYPNTLHHDRNLIIISLAIVSPILAALFQCIQLLDVLYYFAGVKMIITLIKYLPQLHLNNARKSTRGWSIGNIILDLSGGLLSILQSIVDANDDGWKSIAGNPIKIGLGVASIVFDFIFIYQHYFIFHQNYEDEEDARHLMDQEGEL